MISESIVEVTCKQSRCPTCRETYVPVVVTKTRVPRSSIIISKDIIEERERIKSGQMVRMKNGNVWLCICLLSCMSLLMFAATVLFFSSSRFYLVRMQNRCWCFLFIIIMASIRQIRITMILSRLQLTRTSLLKSSMNLCSELFILFI